MDLKTTKIYIVAGGPSLQFFPTALLAYTPATVLVVNDGFLRLPWAHGVVSADSRWVVKRTPELTTWNGTAYLVSDTKPTIPRCVWYQKVRSLGYSQDPLSVNVFGTSGYAALGVAAKLGFKDINLLGFDYTFGTAHWYSNTLPWISGACDNDYKSWAAGFDSLVEPLNTLGVQVVNWGLESRVETFPKKPLRELEHELHVHFESTKQRP